MLLETLTVKLARIKKKKKKDSKNQPKNQIHQNLNTINQIYIVFSKSQNSETGSIQVPNWKFFLLEKALPQSCWLLGPDYVVKILLCQAAGGNRYRPASQFSWLFAFEQ